MRAEGLFSVASFVPTAIDPPPAAPMTALPVGLVIMEKHFEGAVAGRSTTWFLSAFESASGGTYVALESFAGTIDGRDGTFNFAHSATSSGTDRHDDYFVIVPGSGTGQLQGIRGSGGLSVGEEHRIWFDYELA